MEHTNAKRIEVSSDAAVRLRLAGEWLQDYPADKEVVILAHSAEAANDFLMRTASARGASFGVRRFTLNGLAARLAQPVLAKSGAASASTLSFVAVVARAIHSLQLDDKLTYFAPVATRPGFPVATARTLGELRMNEIDVQSLERLARGGQDLAQITQAVEVELERSKLADRAAIFRAAIEAVRGDSGHAADSELLGFPLLLLDLQVSDRLEVALVREIALRSANVLATVPSGDERVASALEVALGCKRQLSDAVGPVNSLSSAKQHLFAESMPPVSALDESLKLSNWPGEPRECVEIVRSIQAEAARGVPFDQMAVFLNSPGEYRSHLEEAFSRAEIPVYFAQGSSGPDPAGRAMLALLSCAAEGLSARRFAEYLSLGQVPDPDANNDADALWQGPRDELISGSTREEETGSGDAGLGGEEKTQIQGREDAAVKRSADMEAASGATPDVPKKPVPVELVQGEPVQGQLFQEEMEKRGVIEGHLRAPWRWEQLLVDSAVIGGKERWVRRLEGLANELRLQLAAAEEEETVYAERIEKQLGDLEHLRAFALPAIGLLAALPDQASWGEWLSHLRELAAQTLRDPSGMLATLAELEPMAPVGPVDLYEVRTVLEPRLRDLSVEPPRRSFGSVFVGPVAYARGLAFDVVFIPGLAEKIFPRKLVDDPILPDAQRQEVAGNTLSTRRERLELERLALRLAIGAARERAYLSYPRIDVQQSRPRVPSFYALEAIRAAEGALPGFEQLRSRAESATRARLGWPAPESPAAAIDESEYDLALLGTLVDAEPKTATGSAHYLLDANPHLARALRARFRRWSRKWTINDGIVEVDDLGREAMARHQLSARAFSSTALQRYASCPYQFFLNAVFRLRPREDVAAIEVMDPLTRGALFHETQFAVLTKLKGKGLLPVDPTELTEACNLVNDSLDEVAQLYEDKLAPAIPRVWRDSIEAIRADLREWLRLASEKNDGWVPDKFELAFAMDHIGSQDRDPASVSEPVEIAGGLKLRGSIDLVERHANGKVRVTDHKTGKARAATNLVVGGGKSLQPLLYALAAEKLLEREVESGRLYYCTAAGGYEERVVDLDRENRADVTLVIATIDQALADGFLPAAPEKGACMWCDFLGVCGSREELRTGRKPATQLTELTRIRELP
ncbi:MAG: PD-(D/E)XK nuclease family protein [Pyrinomonadaceae bacterium]